jgi:hypothetical protein
MWEIHFKGFATKEQADAFLTWYGNSGEQELATTLEIRDSEFTSMNMGISTETKQANGTTVISVPLDIE